MKVELDLLLGKIADLVDLDHCKRVDALYRKALGYEQIDRPPLVVQSAFGATMKLPRPWDSFRRYTYRETFEYPSAMLQNQLLDRVVPGVLLRDDSPLAVRNNHGTIQIASILGGNWRLVEDHYPWVEPLKPIEGLEQVARSADAIPDDAGVLSRAIDTLRFYRQKLDDYPPLSEVIQISLPDLQGPLDTAEQLWGSDIYYAFHEDRNGLLQDLLAKVTRTTVEVSRKLRQHARDRLDPFANTQHTYVIPGRIMIRDDSAVLLSPSSYAEVVAPHDSRLLKEVGTGSIHFCGNGQHLVDSLLKVEGVRGLDFGQPRLMDTKWIYSRCSQAGIALTNLQPGREALLSGQARCDFPTGVVFTYDAQGIEEAAEVVEGYHERSRSSSAT